MKLFRVFAIATMAILSGVSAQAGVVLYSNLGASGVEDTTNNSSSDSSATARQASGFETGSAVHKITVVSLGLGSLNSNTTVPITVSIFASSVDVPERPFGPALFTSDSVFVDQKGVYSFGFGAGATLAANTTYWIVPSAGVKWFYNAADALPTVRNSSGYSFVGTRESMNGGATWADSGDLALTLSIATPEPGLTTLLCLGGIGLIRRRRKK